MTRACFSRFCGHLEHLVLVLKVCVNYPLQNLESVFFFFLIVAQCPCLASLLLPEKLATVRNTLNMSQRLFPSAYDSTTIFDYACIRPISSNSGKRYNPLPNNPRPTSTVPWLRDFLHICRDYLYFKAPSTNSRHAVTGSDQCILCTDTYFPLGGAFPKNWVSQCLWRLCHQQVLSYDQCGR